MLQARRFVTAAASPGPGGKSAPAEAMPAGLVGWLLVERMQARLAGMAVRCKRASGTAARLRVASLTRHAEPAGMPRAALREQPGNSVPGLAERCQLPQEAAIEPFLVTALRAGWIV